LARPDLDAAEQAIRDRHDDDAVDVEVAEEGDPLGYPRIVDGEYVEGPDGEGDALGDVEALEAEADEQLIDLTSAQLDGLAAAAAGRVHPSTRTDRDAGTINSRILNALDGYGLVDLNGHITDDGRGVLERYRKLGAPGAQ
jgi:hypothetical protein